MAGSSARRAPAGDPAPTRRLAARGAAVEPAHGVEAVLLGDSDLEARRFVRLEVLELLEPRLVVGDASDRPVAQRVQRAAEHLAAPQHLAQARLAARRFGVRLHVVVGQEDILEPAAHRHSVVALDAAAERRQLAQRQRADGSLEPAQPCPPRSCRRLRWGPRPHFLKSKNLYKK